MSKSIEERIEDTALYLVGYGWQAFDSKDPVHFQDKIVERIKPLIERENLYARIDEGQSLSQSMETRGIAPPDHMMRWYDARLNLHAMKISRIDSLLEGKNE